MDKKFLKEMKNRLFQEKKRVEKDLSQIAQKSRSIRGDYHARYLELGSKEDENAQEVTLYESRFSLEKDLEDILRKINKALEKIEQGDYGICEKCGQKIPEARLKAFPSAVLCLKCKKK